MKTLLSLTASFALMTLHGYSAVLTGVSNTNPATGVNLTTAGSRDWAIWDYTTSTGVASRAATNTKSGGPGLFGPITAVGGGSVRGFGSGTQTYSYTNGTSPGSLASSIQGFAGNTQIDLLNAGTALSLTGNPGQLYQVDIWTSGFRAVGTLTATLDGATPLTLVSRTFGATKESSLFTLTFRPDEIGDLLNLSFALTTDGTGTSSHVGIQAIAVSAVPEPTAGMFLLSGILVFSALRQRTSRRLA